MPYGVWNSSTLYPGYVMFVTTGQKSDATNSIIRSVTRTGSITPNFGRLSNKRRGRIFYGSLPVNPYSFLLTEWRPDNGSIFRRWSNPLNDQLYEGAATSILIGPVADVREPSPSDIAFFVDEADRKVLEKLKDMKVNLAQVFAERARTANLIGDTAIRLAAAFSFLRRGDMRSAASALGTNVSRRQVTRFNAEYRRGGGNAISRGWLELQYGWIPLLSDVYGSAEELAKRQSDEVRDKVRYRRSRVYEKTENLSSPFPNSTIHKYRFDVSVGIWFKTTGAALQQASAVGITNPALLAWELLPYSFVVDWFVPVGSWLSTLDATLGLAFEKGFRTTHLHSTAQRYATPANSPVGAQFLTGYSVSSRKKVQTIRVRLTTFPSAGFPEFRNPFSWTRAANAVALLSQVFVNRKL